MQHYTTKCNPCNGLSPKGFPTSTLLIPFYPCSCVQICRDAKWSKILCCEHLVWIPYPDCVAPSATGICGFAPQHHCSWRKLKYMELRWPKKEQCKSVLYLRGSHHQLDRIEERWTSSSGWFRDVASCNRNTSNLARLLFKQVTSSKMNSHLSIGACSSFEPDKQLAEAPS